jgi:hypothetical protein
MALQADPRHPPLPTSLAEMGLGPGGLARVPSASLPPEVPARLVRLPEPRERGGHWPGSEHYRIEVQRGLFRDKRNFYWTMGLVAHEIGEFGVRVLEGYVGQDCEEYAEDVGLEVRAPRAAVERMVRENKGKIDYQEIADELFLTEIEAAQRVADVLDLPTFIMARGAMFHAGPEYGWPSNDPDSIIARGQLKMVEVFEVKGGIVFRADPI